ncbi:MAG: hypothetical protein ACOY0T_26245 [Myxococcota bacterium]
MNSARALNPSNPFHLARIVALAAAFPLLAACASSHSNYEVKHLPDGTLRIKCQGALPACIARAETACRGNNYEIIKARDQRDTYGPEYGTSKVEVRSSEAIVRCGAKGQPAPPLLPEAQTPAHPPDESATAAVPPPPAPARTCTPGATQACIGPGRCEGGQSCLPDGTAFGPCDCGTLGPPPVAPSATPPSASPAAGAGASPSAPPAAATPAKPPSSTGAPAPARTPPPPPPPAGGAAPLKAPAKK